MKWCLHHSKKILTNISMSISHIINIYFYIKWSELQCLFLIWSLKQMSGASINVRSCLTAVSCTNKYQEHWQLTFCITQKFPVSGSSWACDKSIVTSALTSTDVKNSSTVPCSNITSREVLSGRQPTYDWCIRDVAKMSWGLGWLIGARCHRCHRYPKVAVTLECWLPIHIQCL